MLDAVSVFHLFLANQWNTDSIVAWKTINFQMKTCAIDIFSDGLESEDARSVEKLHPWIPSDLGITGHLALKL